MKFIVTEELKGIFKAILDENKSLEERTQVESDDMFESEHFSGGFDATEQAFCFSLYHDEKEYWFQLALDEVQTVSDETSGEIEVRQADVKLTTDY